VAPASPPEQPAAQRDLLADRYGRPDRAARRCWYAVGAVVAVLALAWIAWVGFFGGGRTAVSGTVTRFSVLSPTRMRADVSVTGPANRAAQCTVQALDTSGAVVGRTVARVPAGQSTRAVAVEVRVVSPADSVTVVGCTTNE